MCFRELILLKSAREVAISFSQLLEPILRHTHTEHSLGILLLFNLSLERSFLASISELNTYACPLHI